MSNKWCLVGAVSGEILTYRDHALVHDNKLPSYWGEELTCPLKDHPDMDNVQFPLAQHMDQFQ